MDYLEVAHQFFNHLAVKKYIQDFYKEKTIKQVKQNIGYLAHFTRAVYTNEMRQLEIHSQMHYQCGSIWYMWMNFVSSPKA